MKLGSKFKLFSREYSVLSFGGDAKSPEVRIADELTKIEFTITGSGKNNDAK